MNLVNDAWSLYYVMLGAAVVGVVWWAFGARRKQRFERDGEMPFDEPE
jgi:cbb3-type cytochrome oxidase subunit 3